MAGMRSNDQVFATTQFRRLSDEQCQKLYWACLEILERTGVRLYDQEALDLLKKAGVSATDGNRVRIPSGLVEKAFTTVPKRVTLCDRHGKRVMPVEGHRSFFGPGSDCLNIIDHRTGERRQPASGGSGRSVRCGWMRSIRSRTTICRKSTWRAWPSRSKAATLSWTRTSLNGQ